MTEDTGDAVEVEVEVEIPADAAAALSALEGDPTTVTLVDAGAWVMLEASDDPFADRPDEVACSALGYGEENGYFEVDTEVCGYGTFRQPLLESLAEGDEIVVVFWHLELWAEEAATGHIAIAFGDGVLVESTIAIPGEPETHTVFTTAPRDLAAGEWIYFHAHNHGYNNWSLGTIQAQTLR